MREAQMEKTEAGLEPASDGWFVVNVADAAGRTRAPADAVYVGFEGEQPLFPHFGVNVVVLPEGKPNCLYHRESNQEGFLVLDGEPLLVVEGEERRLRRWDFVHCPPECTHVFVGPGVILMIGARNPDEKVHYPVEETARKHGASAAEASDDPKQAYPAAGWGQWEPARVPWPA